MDLDILNNLIEGRTTPHIYAFSTNTIPNYIKVGDTYRPVAIRLKEWKKHFPDLQKEFQNKATIDEKTFFRDYAVHTYLESDLNKERLTPENLKRGLYFSNEFFKDTLPKDIENAIDDIQKNYKKSSKYQYYNSETKLPKDFQYESLGIRNPRPNQKETIDRFTQAVKNGRTNLLMYAVMRFGKSFTALSCAVENNYKLVVVVSAKADVKEEWKKTVESIENFKQYCFIDEEKLKHESTIISSIINSKNEKNRVVIFLTLQDLQGTSIKIKHEELFNHSIDLLIVDETHFGARAEKYGEVLKKTESKKENDDYIITEEAEKQIKEFNTKVTLHLSGTPYRILMGSEFQKEDIIAFYQFSDIIHEKEKWDDTYLLNDDNKEWDNPYYGFPQMIRFAFNPNETSRKKIEELKKDGVSYAFSELLKPKSISFSLTNEHTQFVHEKEVLELFQCIDGSKTDENLLGFLDYDKIKNGKMCQHIVIVLPYCASCDALQELLLKHSNTFKNINKYEIINISGISNSYKNIKSIKDKIKKCESNNTKTITLTVNRMLTGSTVPEWDTMLYFKDTASPQEYDQAIYRLQNQYIKEYKNSINGKADVIKYNMKPQTLLVDFDPCRMFYMQEQKSLIYNVNTETAGNNELQERIKEELRISPIITINAKKMQKIEATDILNAVSDYSKNKGVAEEVIEIPVDLSLLNYSEIKKAIEAENELGSKDGLTISATKSEDGSEIDIPDDFEETENTNETKVTEEKKEEIKETNIVKQFRTYYARILFYSFLTKNEVKSLQDIIVASSETENSRILDNLGLKISILKLFNDHMNIHTLNKLDYKIRNINQLSNDKSISGMDKCLVGLRKFGKIGISEVVTPIRICNEMVSLIPDSDYKKIIEKKGKILDFAGKVGEFAIATYNKYIDLGYSLDAIKDAIYTIPTSSICYEFTRKTYENLGLNVDTIAEKFNTYDLLNVKKNKKMIDSDKLCKLLSQPESFSTISLNDEVEEGENKVKFDIILGNPPYMEMDGGAKASAKPIYQLFISALKELSNNYLSTIIPTRWYAGGKGLDVFRESMLSDKHIRELHDFLNPDMLFPDTNIRGGVCYFVWDKKHDNEKKQVKVVSTYRDSSYEAIRPMKVDNIDIFIRDYRAVAILKKITKTNFTSIENYISSRKPFGLEGTFVKTKFFHDSIQGLQNPLTCYSKGQKVGYIEKKLITVNIDWIDKWKVFIPRANNIGTELNDDNLNSFIGKPNTICTESYIAVGADLDLNENMSSNLAEYLKTKFARYMHSLSKASQDATSKTFKFVPLQDFSKSWTDKELYEKYNLTNDEINFIESMIKPME